jgi:hypothetical protein
VDGYLPTLARQFSCQFLWPALAPMGRNTCLHLQPKLQNISHCCIPRNRCRSEISPTGPQSLFRQKALSSQFGTTKALRHLVVVAASDPASELPNRSSMQWLPVVHRLQQVGYSHLIIAACVECDNLGRHPASHDCHVPTQNGWFDFFVLGNCSSILVSNANCT